MPVIELSGYNLKHCPFCGHDGLLLYHDIPYLNDYNVECTNSMCLASYVIGMTYDTAEEAVAAWNTRYNE